MREESNAFMGPHGPMVESRSSERRRRYRVLTKSSLLLSIFLFSSLATANPALPLQRPSSTADDGVASFVAGAQGRIVWRIGRTQLPWHGSYEFRPRHSADGEAPPTVVLLSVADATTGIKVAECQTPVSPQRLLVEDGEDEAEPWYRVRWTLTETELQCNTTANLKIIASALQTANADNGFVVRIQAAKGPRCIRNLIADDEQWSGCPPRLRRHAYQAEHLACGCGSSTKTTLTVRRKPLPVHSLRQGPISDATESTDDPETPLPSGSPTFPMFHFTTSMEKDTTRLPVEEATIAATEFEETADTETDETQTAVTAQASPCEDFECRNNGTCSEDAQGRAHCTCAHGFGGEHCETDLCAELGCENGGSCQVRNGRAVCSCPAGVHGDRCHHVQPVCNPKCENGGVCSIGPAGQPFCRCQHGFLGTNCNLRDICATGQPCAQYGREARCFKDAHDISRFETTLQDAVYSCQCPNGASGFIECNKTMNFGRDPQPPVDPTAAFVTEKSIAQSGEAARSSQQQSAQQSAETRNSNSQQQQSAETPPPVAPTSSSAQQPAVESNEGPQIQHVVGQTAEEPSVGPPSGVRPSGAPAFPLTGMPVAGGLMSSLRPIVLPRPAHSTEAPVVPPAAEVFVPPTAHNIATTTVTIAAPVASSAAIGSASTSAEFTRLPIERLPTTPLPASAAAEEEEGDNGFERITQIGGAETTEATATEMETTVGEEEEETTAAQPDGPMGPEHSIVEQNGGQNEVQPEFHTIPPTQPGTSPTTTTAQPSTPPPSNNNQDLAAVGGSEERGGNGSSPSWTWIIALSAVGIIVLASTVGGLLMARYVRRSRRLHGKYNPAREENNAVHHSSYAMPMTAVNKDERLI